MRRQRGLFNIVNVHTSVDVRDLFFTDSNCYIFWVKKKIVIFKNLEMAILCLDSHPL